MTYELKIATGPIAWMMRRLRFLGWTSFWNTIYVLPGHEHNVPLLRHEETHLDQIAKDGRLLFTLKYSYWTLKYGYWNNPYEIAARKASYSTK